MSDFRYSVYLLLFLAFTLAQAETLTGCVVRVTDGNMTLL